MVGKKIVFVAAMLISVTGIKVSVEKSDENNQSTKSKIIEDSESSEKPSYYNDQVDSSVIPQNSHHASGDTSDDIAVPATYLLPPSVDNHSEYYKPTEEGEQTDWYPIEPAVHPLPRQLLPPKEDEDNAASDDANQSDSIYSSPRSGEILNIKTRIAPIPSRDLQPPSENAANEYIASISDTNTPRTTRLASYSTPLWNGPIISIPKNIRDDSLPKISYIQEKKKNPTKLYPKKYAGPFKPIPISLDNFNDESLVGITNDNRPLTKINILNQDINNEYEAPFEDKSIFNTDNIQQNYFLKGKPDVKQVEETEPSESKDEEPSLEQDTSATNHRVPSEHAYAVPLRHGSKSIQTQSHHPPADGERTEFRMHGMKGPHSYQFGYDTGKGKNRQFRYEERDNNGRVKGHYGYMDKNGKLRVVNYDADPEHGFRAEPPVDTE